MNRLLVAIIVAAVFFSAGWFGARFYYTPIPPEPDIPTAWHGGACADDVHHLVIPTSDGEKVLECTATLDDVVALLGAPHQQHIVATSEGERTLLFYYADSQYEMAPRAWLALANGKLLAAYALDHAPAPQPEEE